jgi:cell wall-associated NlpC family hydrolase
MHVLAEYALSFLGVPYIYGGNYRDGLDCSGFVCEVLRAGGLIKGDYSAQGLYDELRNFPQKRGANSLAFFGADDKNIVHVGFCLNTDLMIEAGGGDQWVTSIEIAKKQGACVRIRPINFRRDFLTTIMPIYPVNIIRRNLNGN